MVSVPCNGCTACCQVDAGRRRAGLVLDPAVEGDISRYDTVPCVVDEVDKQLMMLRHAANGDCIYLDRKGGCTIHDWRPQVCRMFDCRQLYLKTLSSTRSERRKWVRDGFVSQEVLRAGRMRLKRISS